MLRWETRERDAETLWRDFSPIIPPILATLLVFALTYLITWAAACCYAHTLLRFIPGSW
jgi:hypothetical protein